MRIDNLFETISISTRGIFIVLRSTCVVVIVLQLVGCCNGSDSVVTKGKSAIENPSKKYLPPEKEKGQFINDDSKLMEELQNNEDMKRLVKELEWQIAYPEDAEEMTSDAGSPDLEKNVISGNGEQ